MSYVYIAVKTLQDFGTFASAIKYCESVAAQQGADAMDYKHAADSLRDASNKKIVEFVGGEL